MGCSGGVGSGGVSASSPKSGVDYSDAEDDAIIPGTKFLKSPNSIQHTVDQRLQELVAINENGTFKSQRGGTEQINVKYQVPWLQNFLLAGTSKNRVSYDSLSIFQWVAGICTIMREETSVKTKNAMLEYVTELMEDAQDFGWPSAKGAHTLLLCRMEEGKIEWHMTDKIDRLRKAHAQKVVSNPTPFSKKKGTDSQGLPCKFYQNR